MLMAKEEDLKNVDLKVFVNCCEGCKKKVLKALSIKGVLRTEVHPSLPKITVTGNVDVKTLIKKLAKIGKTAELWPAETTAKPEKETKSESVTKESSTNTNDKEKSKEINVDKQEKKSISDKPNASNSGNVEKTSKGKIKENEGGIKGDKIKENGPEEMKSVVTTIPQTNYLINPNIMQPQIQGFYPPVQLSQCPVPYYMMSMNAPCCIHDHCHCQLPLYHPTQQSMGFADYFNDENTVGCHVM